MVHRLHIFTIVVLASAMVVVATWQLWLPFAFMAANWHDRRQRAALERPGDANWQMLKSLGNALWSDKTDHTQFSSLNNGDWQRLCVVGGYVLPINVFEGQFGSEKQDQWTREWLERQSPMPENDLAVMFEDRLGRAHAHYFMNGGNGETQHHSLCIENRSRITAAD